MDSIPRDPAITIPNPRGPLGFGILYLRDDGREVPLLLDCLLHFTAGLIRSTQFWLIPAYKMVRVIGLIGADAIHAYTPAGVASLATLFEARHHRAAFGWNSQGAQPRSLYLFIAFSSMSSTLIALPPAVRPFHSLIFCAAGPLNSFLKSCPSIRERNKSSSSSS